VVAVAAVTVDGAVVMVAVVMCGSYNCYGDGGGGGGGGGGGDP